MLQEVQKEEDLHFSLVGKPKVILTSMNLDDFPIEVKNLLDECANIIMHDLPSDLPPVIIISHHIELIPGASLPNKAVYILTPHEKRRNQKASTGVVGERIGKRNLDSLCSTHCT